MRCKCAKICYDLFWPWEGTSSCCGCQQTGAANGNADHDGSFQWNLLHILLHKDLELDKDHSFYHMLCIKTEYNSAFFVIGALRVVKASALVCPLKQNRQYNSRALKSFRRKNTVSYGELPVSGQCYESVLHFKICNINKKRQKEKLLIWSLNLLFILTYIKAVFSLQFSMVIQIGCLFFVNKCTTKEN